MIASDIKLRPQQCKFEKKNLCGREKLEDLNFLLNYLFQWMAPKFTYSTKQYICKSFHPCSHQPYPSTSIKTLLIIFKVHIIQCSLCARNRSRYFTHTNESWQWLSLAGASLLILQMKMNLKLSKVKLLAQGHSSSSKLTIVLNYPLHNLQIIPFQSIFFPLI